jgi:hypothetical protein
MKSELLDTMRIDTAGLDETALPVSSLADRLPQADDLRWRTAPLNSYRVNRLREAIRRQCYLCRPEVIAHELLQGLDSAINNGKGSDSIVWD